MIPQLSNSPSAPMTGDGGILRGCSNLPQFSPLCPVTYPQLGSLVQQVNWPLPCSRSYVTSVAVLVPGSEGDGNGLEIQLALLHGPLLEEGKREGAVGVDNRVLS